MPALSRHAKPVLRRRRLITLVLVAACLPACHVRIGGGGENDADRLRRENLGLHEEIAGLRRQLELRQAEAESLRQSLASAGGAALPGAQVPRVVALRFEGASGALDTNGDGVPDILRVYVRPIDQQGRFLVATGQAVVQAVAIQAGAPPRVLAEKTFAPAEFDAGYRSGLVGTHFTLDVPLPAEAADVQEATVKVTFTDAATGAVVTQQAPMRIAERR
jgi:hypothetical protein